KASAKQCDWAKVQVACPFIPEEFPNGMMRGKAPSTIPGVAYATYWWSGRTRCEGGASGMYPRYPGGIVSSIGHYPGSS
uniref:Uncharacterized protein n=1 Tax=Cannabis sativa TaxID=3483 RepID=A0A803QRT9_CANSA